MGFDVVDLGLVAMIVGISFYVSFFMHDDSDPNNDNDDEQRQR